MKNTQEFPMLNIILQECLKPKEEFKDVKFLLPGAWTVDPVKNDLSLVVSRGELVKPVEGNSPYHVISECIKKIIQYNEENKDLIEEEKKSMELKSGTGVRAVNTLARVLSMYDHNGDGIIGSSRRGDITLNSDGIRETGTFIKNILVLPYLKGLGFNTVHLQPITEIGIYGRKGNLGSPFAIRDPFTIDPKLSDPLFDFSAEESYLAFLEASRAMGMMVVQEVIPRTLSIDSTILEEFPHYGYWIKADAPRRMPDYYNSGYEYNTSQGKRRFQDRKSFEAWFFGEYQNKIYSGKYSISDLIDVNLTDPEYVSYFMPTPDIVNREEKQGKLVGYYYKKDGDGNKIKGEIDEEKRAEVFPAFCDTPFEIQPFWQDVTYLRLYVDREGDMPILNPLSYVTAKFFKDVEPEVESKYRNQPVFDMITRYFDKFKNMGVDGFVMDMGHALPDELKRRIKEVLPSVWEENLAAPFSFLAANSIVITGKVFAYGQPSYNNPSEMKYYETHPEETVTYHMKNMKKLFEEVSEFDDYKGKMFGFPDNYNTKRIGQSPATRILSLASYRKDSSVQDFTGAPVDQEKARKITLLYDTLFRIFSEKDGSPFIINPVFGTEFVATSTINVGLNTHIQEANRFYDYMSSEEQERNPEAEKLLLMSKPDRLSGEWTNELHLVKEILEVNSVIKKLKPLLERNKHVDVLTTRYPEILFLSLSDLHKKGENIAIVSNLDLDNEHEVLLPFPVREYYLNRPDRTPAEGDKGEILLPPGCITVFSY